MTELNLEEMMNAGAHFGHQTKRWNPKMKPYLYGARSGVHIIDLGQTLQLAQKAFRTIEEIVAQGGSVLFVGTKKQAQPVIEEEAKRCSMPYVTRRWLGGMLTNYETIRKSVDRLLELESRREKNDLAGFTKRERLGIDREIAKLREALGGIANNRRLPAALFVVDPHTEHIAVHEAHVLEIPVIAVTDTNCDPDPIDYPIPANDDSVRSIRIFVAGAADACLAGLARRDELARQEGNREGGKKGPARKARDMEGAGRAYVSKVDAFEQGTEVDSFSATVTPEEEKVPELVEDIEKKSEE